jgi:hypothetical protein
VRHRSPAIAAIGIVALLGCFCCLDDVGCRLLLLRELRVRARGPVAVLRCTVPRCGAAENVVSLEVQVLVDGLACVRALFGCEPVEWAGRWSADRYELVRVLGC